MSAEEVTCLAGPVLCQADDALNVRGRFPAPQKPFLNALLEMQLLAHHCLVSFVRDGHMLAIMQPLAAVVRCHFPEEHL